MSTKARFNKLPKYGFGGIGGGSSGGEGGMDISGLIQGTYSDNKAMSIGSNIGGTIGSAFGPIGKTFGAGLGAIFGGAGDSISQSITGKMNRVDEMALRNSIITQRMPINNRADSDSKDLLANPYLYKGYGKLNYYAKGGKLHIRGEEELTNYTPQEFGTRSGHEMYVSPYTLLKYLFPKRKKYDKGGKVEPIYTNNPNDPRLQAYNYQLPSDITESRSIIHNNGYKGGLGTGKETIKEIGLLGDAISFYPNPYAQGAGYLMSLPSTALSIYDKPTDPTSYLGLIPNAPLKVASKTIKAASRLNTFLNAANLGIDYEDLNKKALGGSINSNKKYFDNTGKPYEIFADGGKIHIKPENRGKFTASAKAHGMGVQEYASHVLADPHASATMKKRANFARNAAKWHHGDGAPLEQVEDGPNIHPTLGGKLLPLNDEASLVVGDKHGQDSDNDGNEGVTMINPETGQPYAEVENGEIITSDNDVVSNRIKLPDGRSVAEAFAELQVKEGKLKKNIEKGGNYYKVNHYKRDLQDIAKQEQELLDYSEDMRQQYANIPSKMSMGGKLKKYALGEDGKFSFVTNDNINDNNIDNNYYDQDNSSLPTPKIGLQSIIDNNQNNNSPSDNYDINGSGKIGKYVVDKIGGMFSNAPNFMSNLFNAVANSKIRPLPNPITNKYANLKTNYNVNPQLNMIDNDTLSMMKSVDANTSNSAYARINKLALSANSINAKNKILADKENIETNLQNNAALNNQSTYNSNASLLTAHNKDIWNLNKYKMDEASKNIANVEDKLQTMDVDRRMNELDYSKIATDLQGKSPDTYAHLMGTSSFDNAVKNSPELKKSLFDYVSRTGNEQLLSKFILLYGRG